MMVMTIMTTMMMMMTMMSHHEHVGDESPVEENEDFGDEDQHLLVLRRIEWDSIELVQVKLNEVVLYYEGLD